MKTSAFVKNYPLTLQPRLSSMRLRGGHLFSLLFIYLIVLMYAGLIQSLSLIGRIYLIGGWLG